MTLGLAVMFALLSLMFAATATNLRDPNQKEGTSSLAGVANAVSALLMLFAALCMLRLLSTGIPG